MREPYLQVTFRHGKPFAAYYYLPREPGDECVRSRRADSGMIIDFAADGRAIGIEITAPGELSLEAFNRVLKDMGQPAVTGEVLAPLHAA